MYRVLLVEDESAALRYLRALIESHFPEFLTIGTASNGREALELTEKLNPDLILTDVKMPLMDGLELVRRLKELAPQTPAVIISGYEDFEYVRQALNTGVVDYVLKPVTARRLSDVFQRIGDVLRDNADQRMFSIFKRLIGGEKTNGRDEVGIESAVRLAILRYGAPPSRYSHEISIGLTEGSSDGFCALHGRDNHEALLAGPEKRFEASRFLKLCTDALNPHSGLYHTLLVPSKVVRGSQLQEEAVTLFRDVDRSIVVGYNQVLDRPIAKHKSVRIDHVLTSRIENAVINSSAGDLEALITQEMTTWQTSRTPAIELLSGARRILGTIQRVALRSVGDLDLDSVVEQLLARARTFDDFGSSLRRIALQVGGLDADSDEAAERSSLFASIRSYLESSYARQQSVESVRARFRISASYLERLFRTNTGLSFTEYLRQLRIEAAKRLLRESPQMPIKNVARFVGFKDPFYFSRVFRSVAGVAPIEYSRECRSEGPPHR